MLRKTTEVIWKIVIDEGRLCAALHCRSGAVRNPPRSDQSNKSVFKQQTTNNKHMRRAGCCAAFVIKPVRCSGHTIHQIRGDVCCNFPVRKGLVVATH